MKEYQVSARKYRPSKFEDVVGQNHITNTLSNAINNNQIAHAYLFCGPRGVGKTSCARIFAKLINNETSSEYNLFELDGASNNSVDDIRNLIDQVKIPPQIGKYKTYIIDEVHMLSKSAFNAFLKTLEEPPKHSIFILATTEKEKIIPTILSRCQIFDFNRISTNEISNYLQKISTQEDIQVEQETLNLISEKSDGSLRDALSTFDKIYTYCNKKWDYKEVTNILQSLDFSFAIKLTNNIIDENIPECLIQINEVFEKGFDGKEIIQIMIEHFRNLMMIKIPSTQKLIEKNQDFINLISPQSKKFSNKQILQALSCLNECTLNYKNSVNQRFLVELSIMQLCSLSDLDLKKKLLIPNPNLNHKKTDTQSIEDNPNESVLTKKSNLETPNTTGISFNTQEEKKQPLKPKASKAETIKNVGIKLADNQLIDTDLISISDEIIAMKSSNQNNIEEKKEKTEWIENELINKWQLFSQELKKKEKINLHNIFDRYLPKKNNNTIKLKLVSLSEKAEIQEIKSELLFFIRKELKNDFIDLDISISEEKQKNMLHTKEERYSHLLEKNAKIAILKDKLDLTKI